MSSAGLHRHAARRDIGERAVIAALRSVGAMCWQLSERDLPDLMVAWRGVIHLIEVKGELGPEGGEAHAKLRPGQARFFEQAEIGGLPVHVVRSPEQALEAIGVQLVAPGTR